MKAWCQQVPYFFCLPALPAGARLLGISLLLVCLLLPSQKSAIAAEANAQEAQLVRKLDNLVGKSRYAEAIPLAEEMTADSERKYGTSSTNVATSLDRLAILYYRTADYAKAEPLYQRSLKIREKQLGPEHPETATALNNLAAVYRAMGDYGKAESLFRCSLKIMEKQLGPEHPDTATPLNNLAGLYGDMGDYGKAEPLFQRCLKIREKQLGPEHLDTATTLNNLGLLYLAISDYGKAEPLFERSLKIMEKQLGPEHPDMAAPLNNLAGLYRAMGDYAKAESLFQRSLKIKEKQLGPEHLDTATTLNNLAQLYYAMGDYAKAEPLYLRSLKIMEEHLGPEHPNTAKALGILAELYYAIGDYGKAEHLLQRSLKIMENRLGHEHPDTLTTLSSLASLYQATADYRKAEPLYQRSLKVREKRLGPEHPDTAKSLDALGGLYRDIGDYGKAEPLLQRSLKIREKVLGSEHPDTANSLNNLAVLYQDMADYGKAEPLLQRSLKIREKVLGPEHPDTANSLNNLAVLYQDMGNYGKAELFYQRSLNIRERKLGPEHSDTGTSLNNLAELYNALGDYAKAEPLFQRSLKILEKRLGPEHPDTATALGNLAGLYEHRGDFGKAKPLYQRSLKIREKVLGPEHPNTANSLNNLAGLYQDMADYGNAELLFQSSLKIMEDRLGPEHPDTAAALSNLALLYQATEDYRKAEHLYQRSLKIKEKVLGPEHPDTATTLENLAWLSASRADLVQGRLLAQRATAAREKVLGGILSFASERQRLGYQQRQDPYSLSAVLGSAAELAEAILRNKGVVLDSLLEEELVAQSSKDPEMKKMLDERQAAGRLLVKLQFEVPKDVGQEARKRRLAEKEALEQRVENLQKALARNVASLGDVRRALRITVPKVQSALANDAVLLEFARYSRHLGKGKFEICYGVILVANPKVELQTAKAGEVVWVPLGSAKSIERTLKEYGEVMRGERRGELSLLRTLHAQLFEPIQKRLPKGITTLVISPDAELNFMSFATLVNEQDRFLAEQYTIKYVASGRDLVFGRAGKKGSRRLAVFANPAFGEKPAVAGSSATNVVHLTMMTTDQRDYAGFTLVPLPNTLQEAEFLRERSSGWNMQGVMYAGAEATEAEVKAVKSPYILHLSTHGFFLPDTLPCNKPAMNTRLLGRERLPVVLHNPMQRSGLAFAGAQLTLDAWKHGETPDPENDGILMAQEVGTMNLKETWLVVLSACDTGVGEARAGEGVLGLRRGFIQAGAQNLLMTLWPVSDKWTVEMMKAFYERALKDGDAPGALAQVQREYLVKLRKEKNAVMAARLAGPFILTFQGELKQK